MIFKKYFILIVCCVFITQLKAQKMMPDTAGIKPTPLPMSDPKKATLYSLFPGGGQIYNKKYWKLPIIYVGFGLLTYSFVFYNKEYGRVREAYKQKINGITPTDPEFANVPEETLFRVRESYGKSRDLSVVGMAGLYVLNLVDACVDAHLKGFDVSDKLSLSIKPSYTYSFGYTYVGINMKLSLK